MRNLAKKERLLESVKGLHKDTLDILQMDVTSMQSILDAKERVVEKRMDILGKIMRQHPTHLQKRQSNKVTVAREQSYPHYLQCATPVWAWWGRWRCRPWIPWGESWRSISWAPSRPSRLSSRTWRLKAGATFWSPAAPEGFTVSWANVWGTLCSFFFLIAWLKNNDPETDPVYALSAVLEIAKTAHLITSCSLTGLPFNEVYCASKFAIEGACESLAILLQHFNIQWVEKFSLLVIIKLWLKQMRPMFHSAAWVWLSAAPSTLTSWSTCRKQSSGMSVSRRWTTRRSAFTKSICSTAAPFSKILHRTLRIL